MKNKFSENYQNLIKIYADFHNYGNTFVGKKDEVFHQKAENIFDGKSLRHFFQPIKQVIDLTKSKSLIDFGCGKAKFYFNKITIKEIEYKNVIEYWKIQDYYLYDPGVDKFSTYPSIKMDGVICIDVVEHMPPEDVINFIEDIFKFAKKFVFIVIACYPAGKKLPDGRNVHLSIKKPGEWKKIISKIKIKYPNISPYVICSVRREVFVAIS